jgi:acyl-CoA thioesterase FadM
MTATTPIADAAPVPRLATVTTLRPRYEGSNICTWIGFKHVNYLVEEAVLDHFRQSGHPARALYEEFGLCLEITAVDTRILHALHMDDAATAVVEPASKPGDPEARFTVTLSVDRPEPVGTLKAVVSRVRVVLRRDVLGGAAAAVPGDLESFVTAAIGDRAPTPATPRPATSASVDRGLTGARADDPVLAELTAGRNAFGWRWRMPYFYCHFTERVQMSGYLRLMEEVVDLFLADRGVSIKRLLDEQQWIPVVPHSSIRLVGEALMEEDLYTVFTVEEIFKDLTYRSSMNCYVARPEGIVQVAAGSITHGYAVLDGRRDWHLVHFDQRMLDALRGGH